jgi:tRNA(Ile)-lysidine synthase TilS/MesJ
MKYIRNVLAAVRRADRDFSLIDSGDKILVGLSGGKDSLSLLRALSVYGRFANKAFEVKPVYLDLGFASPDLTPLKDYCQALGYTLYVSDSRFVYDILKAHQKPGKHIPCSICSRMKKATMNRIAKEEGYNKVAFAHHNDDAVETLFLNMIHGGRVATFEPKMTLDRAGVTFIRPLIYCREDELRNLAIEEHFPILDAGCPANQHTDREEMKEWLQDIYSKYPQARDNFRSMLINYEPFKLYFGCLEFESEDQHAYALKPVITAASMRGSSFAQTPPLEGECDYLVLHKHRRVGEIAYRHLTDHRVAIFALKGSPRTQILAIQELLQRISRIVNPVTFVLDSHDPKVIIATGFAKKKEPGIKGVRFVKRIQL